MEAVFWPAIALIVAAFHASRNREGRSRGETAGIFLRWWLIIAVGVGGIVGAAFHVFDGKQIAEEICFTRGDGGFQFENAMGDLAIGIAALACIWIRNPWWYAAVILVLTIQFFGDGYGHIYQMIENDNHCEDNTGLVLWSDFILPIVSIGLFVLWRSGSPPASSGTSPAK
ncbi:MAG: DUF6790 family protein [Solirubrobacterales bacterium]